MARTRRPRGLESSQLIEADFSLGMRRDPPRSAIPDGGVYDALDFMLERPGVAYKRGGTSYAGPVCAGTFYQVAVAYADFNAGSQLLSIGDNGNLYRITSGTTTDLGASGLGTGFSILDKPKLRGQKLVLMDSDGSTGPRMYNGTTIAALGGTPPGARYAEIWKTRLAVAGNGIEPQRLYFSPTPDIEATWNTAVAWTDFDHHITGMAALQGLMLVFSRGHTEALRGDTPPPGGNLSRDTIASVGCSDSRSIVTRDGYVIFASPRGVYLSNGASFVSLTGEGGIDSYWQQLLVGYESTGWTLTGGMYRNFYFITVRNQVTGETIDTLLCNVPRRAWSRLSNFHASMYASSLGVSEELYYADVSDRVVKAAGIFSPTAATRLDANGFAVTGTLETRMLGRGPGIKNFGFGFLDYDMRDAGTEYPTLAVSTAVGVNAPTFTATQESPLGRTSNFDRRRFMGSSRGQGVTVKLVQSGASTKTEIYAVEMEEMAHSLVEAGVS